MRQLGVKRGDLLRAYSHPVALEQCRDFFAKNPKIQPTPFYDTAGSVKYVIEKKLQDAAGIAGAQAAKAYKGHILAAGIEDDKRNFTRFFLIRKKRRVLPGATRLRLPSASKISPARSSRPWRYLPCAISA